MTSSMQFTRLRQDYRTRKLSPVQMIEQVYQRIDARGQDYVWTNLADRANVRSQALALASRINELDALPLFGLPFGV